MRKVKNILTIVSTILFLSLCMPFILHGINCVYAGEQSCVLTDNNVKAFYKNQTLNERISFMNYARNSRPDPYVTKEDKKSGMHFKMIDNEKLLPSMGDCKILVLPVAFADNSSESEETVSEIENKFFAEEDLNSEENPYESLAAYYYRSSFKQLNITGQVMDWYTASQDKNYYNTVEKKEELINEVIQFYDDSLDYGEFDSKKDGYIDGLYVYFAGESEGWGTAFGSNTIGTVNDSRITNNEEIKVGQYACLDSVDCKTIIYQTGLLLGLEEYYAYGLDEVEYNSEDNVGSTYVKQVLLSNWSTQEIMNADDMMANMLEDHNAYSKMILGWTEPVVITEDTEDLRVNCLQRTFIPNGGQCIIIPSKGDITADKFFVVEFDDNVGNNGTSNGKSSSTGDFKFDTLRVFKVHEDKHNASSRHKTTGKISRVENLKYNSGYKSITPYSPIRVASFFYNENTDFEPSGVTIKAKVPYFGAFGIIDVSIDNDLSSEYKSALGVGDIINLKLSTGLELRICGGDSVDILDKQNNVVKTMKFGYSNRDGSNLNTCYAMFSAVNKLDPGEYTIKVPKDILIDTIGHKNEEMIIPFEITEPTKDQIDELLASGSRTTNFVKTQEGNYAVMRGEGDNVYFTIVNDDSVIQDVKVSLDEPITGGFSNSLHALNDGNFLFTAASKMYIVSKSGIILHSKSMNYNVKDIKINSDNTICFRSSKVYEEAEGPYFTDFITDYEFNEISSTKITKYISDIKKIDDKGYFARGYHDKILTFYDTSYNKITSLDMTGYASDIKDVLRNDDGTFTLLCDYNDDDYIIRLNEEYEIIYRKKINSPYVLSEMMRIKNGYAFKYRIIDSYSPSGMDYGQYENVGSSGGITMHYGQGWAHSLLGVFITDNDFKPVDSMADEQEMQIQQCESGKTVVLKSSGGFCSFVDWKLANVENNADSFVSSSKYKINLKNGIITNTGDSITVKQFIDNIVLSKDCTLSLKNGLVEANDEDLVTDKHILHIKNLKTEEQQMYRMPELVGHSWGEWETITEPTCMEKGEAKRECSLCKAVDKKDIDATGHSWETDLTVDRPATCTEDGSQSIHCRNCSATKESEQIDATGHSWGEWETITEPTCTEKGEAKRVCNLCEAVDKKDSFALGHNLEVTNVKKATCSEDGNLEHWTCLRCEKIFSDSEGNTEIEKINTIIQKVSFIDLSSTAYAYDGGVKTPSVIVKNLQNTILNIGDDYTIVYGEGRKSIGRYQVTIDLKGNYSGTKALYYTIGPKNPKAVSCKLYGYDDVNVSWSNVSGESGYAIYCKKSTSEYWTYIKSTTLTSLKKSNLSDGIKYVFKVVPYKTKDGHKCYSSGKTSSIYTLKKIDIPTVVKYSSSKVKVSWVNIVGESGYQISKSTSKSKNGTVYTYGTTTGKSKIISTKKNKTYYYKVRVYKTVSSKKIYGPWSTAVAYKLK